MPTTAINPASMISMITSSPLAMTPVAAAALVRTLSAEIPSIQAPEAEPVEKNDGAVAIIPVYGPLMARDDFFTQFFSLATYEQIHAALSAAVDDDGISSIVLDIDSPGGQVAGLFDLCDAIRAAQQEKPVLARASGLACSAAYAIGASAGKFYISEASTIGSIGVIMTHVDWSKLNEKIGVAVTHITSGEAKADGSPDMPLSKEATKRLQAEVHALADIFFEHVSADRDLPVEKIRDMQAKVFIGKAAVEQGLADGIASFDTIIRDAIQVPEEGEDMPKETETAAPVVLSAAVVEGPDTKALDEARAAGMQAERERSTEIESLTLMGHEGLALKAKAEGWDVSKFMKAQTVAEQGLKTAHMDALKEAESEPQADATPKLAVVPVATELGTDATDEDIEATWKATKAIRDEFTCKEDFSALVKSDGFKL